MPRDGEENKIIKIDHATSIVDGYLMYHQERIDLQKVSSIRYGWLPIRVEMYRIGGRYTLEIATAEKRLRINMRYYFGIFHNRQFENFNYLLNEIWDVTVGRLLDEMTRKISDGGTVSFGKCEVNADGITCKGFFIHWNDLSYQKLYNRLTINSMSNSGIWTNLYYTETDNVQVLVEFLDNKFGDPKTEVQS